jgi:hypothetical protein
MLHIEYASDTKLSRILNIIGQIKKGTMISSGLPNLIFSIPTFTGKPNIK